MRGTYEDLNGRPPHPAPHARRENLKVSGKELHVPMKLPFEEVERLTGRQIDAVQHTVARYADGVRVDR
jgi:hypothetical protein